VSCLIVKIVFVKLKLIKIVMLAISRLLREYASGSIYYIKDASVRQIGYMGDHRSFIDRLRELSPREVAAVIGALGFASLSVYFGLADSRLYIRHCR
jgi:hypothetical protein